MKGYAFVLTFISLSCLASENRSTYRFSAGIGHQYGGVVGAQFSYTAERSKFYGSLGLVGAAVGFETTFNENKKHAFGLTLGSEAIQSEDGFAFVTYNYHFNGLDQEGFIIGTGIGVTREDELGLFGNSGNTESSAALTFNFGYKF